MAADLFYLPFRPAIDANGLTVSGAKLYFYATGTSTPQAVYSDVGLTTELAHPVVANAAGIFPAIYLNDGQSYRLVLTDAAGVTLNETDPYTAGVAGEAGPKGDPGSAGEGYATKAALALAGDTAVALDDASLNVSGQEGRFIFGSPTTTQVEYDWTQTRYIPKASVPAGGSGGWVRPYDGTVTLEHGGSGTRAAFSWWNLLTSDSTLMKGLTRGMTTTVGIGNDRVPNHSGYADKAAALLDIATFDVGDLISCTDSTYYLKTDASTLERVRMSTLNGVTVQGLAPKFSGLTHEGGRPAAEALIDIDAFDVVFRDFHADGNHEPTWWNPSGDRLNPEVLVGVRVSGYNFAAYNFLARHFANDVMEIAGTIGHMTFVNCNFAYSGGVGMTVRGNSVTNFISPLFEGLAGGGGLIAPRVNSGDATYSTQRGYWIRQGFKADITYDESSFSDTYTYRTEGAYGCQLGEVVTWASSRTTGDIQFGNASGNTGFYQSSIANWMGPTTKHNLKVTVEDKAWNNSVIRMPGLPSLFENTQMVWSDLAPMRGNTVTYLVSPEAYEPGAMHGDLSINTGSSSWSSTSAANAVRQIGSLVDPLLDYRSAYSDGPSVLRCFDMDVLGAGQSAVQITLSINASLAANTAYWSFLTCEGEAYQRFLMRIWDSVNNTYYNWDGGAWTASGSANDFGIWRVIHVTRGQKFYRLPILNDGTARTGVRIGLNIVGEGECRLGNSWFDTIANSAPAGIASGYSFGTPSMRRFTTANRPPATTPFAGIYGHNTTTNTLQLNTGAAYV